VKIACLIHSLDGGGAERVLAALASRLAARGHDVTLITLDDGTVVRHRPAAKVHLVHLNVLGGSRSVTKRVWRSLRRIMAVRRTLRQRKPDVVLSFCDRNNVLVLLSTAATRLPVVIAERSEPAEQQLGPVWERLRSRMYRQAHVIVALTEPAADYLRTRFDVPVRVIASAVDHPPVGSDRRRAAECKQIVAIGRLEQEKGFDRLIDAFAAIGPRHPEWTLRILGDGSKRDALQQQIDACQLSQSVSMPGWKQPVWDELKEATLFVLSSRYEGFPSSLLEAMAMGVPSVAVDCPSGPRAIVGDVSLRDAPALLVPNQLAGLIDGLEVMIADGELRESIGRRGRIASERFDWNRMVDAYEQVLSEAVETQ